MDTRTKQTERLLLIDTCGDAAGVALTFGQQVLATEELERRTASAGIISAVRKLLAQADLRLADLDAVGVVSGPGSFTGIRTGLAVAKGLCAASGLPLAAVSRLEVLADAASLRGGIAVLDAGRGELYVRDEDTGREWMCSDENLIAIAKENHDSHGSGGGKSKRIAIAEERLRERLAECDVVLRPLHVGDALSVVLRRFHEGGSDVSSTDANYVRGESDIYRKQERPQSVCEQAG